MNKAVGKTVAAGAVAVFIVALFIVAIRDSYIAEPEPETEVAYTWFIHTLGADVARPFESETKPDVMLPGYIEFTRTGGDSKTYYSGDYFVYRIANR
jgi:hypothetical protein